MLFRVLCLAAVASASQVGNSKLLKLRGGMDLGPVTAHTVHALYSG